MPAVVSAGLARQVVDVSSRPVVDINSGKMVLGVGTLPSSVSRLNDSRDVCGLHGCPYLIITTIYLKMRQVTVPSTVALA